jgi:hypothetical protein
VIGATIGTNPYAVSRNPLTSNQPSSGSKNRDAAFGLASSAA